MSDLISRQTAMYEFLAELARRERNNLLHTWTTADVKYFIAEILEQLPTVDADEFEWCTDCKEYDHDAHCCHRWTKVIRNTVNDLKAQGYEPVRYGQWIFNPKDAIEMMFTLPKCSECGAESPNGGNYCPSCGAKMKTT